MENVESLQIVVLAVSIIVVGTVMLVLGLVEKESLAIGLGTVCILLGLFSIPLMIMNKCQDNCSRGKATSQNEIIQQVEYDAYVRDYENEILYKY